jgi:hypothetical protein
MVGIVDSTGMFHWKQKYGYNMQTQLKLEYIICFHKRFQSFKIPGRRALILAVIYGPLWGFLRRIMSHETKFCIIHSINTCVHYKTVYYRCVPNWTATFNASLNWFVTLLIPCIVVEGYWQFGGMYYILPFSGPKIKASK